MKNQRTMFKITYCCCNLWPILFMCNNISKNIENWDNHFNKKNDSCYYNLQLNLPMHNIMSKEQCKIWKTFQHFLILKIIFVALKTQQHFNENINFIHNGVMEFGLVVMLRTRGQHLYLFQVFVILLTCEIWNVFRLHKRLAKCQELWTKPLCFSNSYHNFLHNYIVMSTIAFAWTQMALSFFAHFFQLFHCFWTRWLNCNGGKKSCWWTFVHDLHFALVDL